MTNKTEPIACTLTSEEASKSSLEWEDLRFHSTEVTALPAGVRMKFPATYESRIAPLVALEASCCSFLDLSTTVVGDKLTVEVRSANPDAMPVIASLAGIELQ